MTTEPQPVESNILEVDLRAKENNFLHHTDELSLKALNVRRGQSFCISLKFKKSFDAAVHKLKFTAFTGEESKSDEKRGTRSVFGIPDNVKRSAEAKAVWRAELEKKKPGVSGDAEEDGRVGVVITPPANAPIGRYKLFLNFLKEKKELLTLALLFNPWCPDDAVYMEKAKKRHEYVMNEHGVIYKGSGNYIFPMTWDYGQFEDGMVDIAFDLLNQSNKHVEDKQKDREARADPIYVGRLISAMINSEDDSGVLTGNWSGEYFGGKPPTHWNGSYDILSRWRNLGHEAVRYGQCWVFAGVMCTVLRTLGIPARVVTNFESAHDVDGNLIIDSFHADYGVQEQYSPDSVWNFHVWVEGWMKRPDLEPGFDGWQVLDPTPQELSDGYYQCGPASVKAILKGQTDIMYDIPFVFAEVNADCIDWLVKADGSKQQIYSDTKRVGQNISTKSVGSDKRRNITAHYKHPEGSEKERTVFKYAITRDYSKPEDEVDDEEDEEEEDTEDEQDTEPGADEPHISDDEEPVELPKITLRFEEVSKLENGKDVKLNLVLHSEATEPRPLSINLKVTAKTYNGTTHTDIQAELKKETLQPGTDLVIPVVVPFSLYWKPMLDSDVMKISVIVLDLENESEGYFAEEDVVLVDPDIKVTFLSEARVKRRTYLEIIFRNTVSETLKDCSFTLSGSGLWRMEQEIRLPDLPPKRKVRVCVYFFPYKAGEKTLVVDFDCSVFRDIKKSVTVDVKRYLY